MEGYKQVDVNYDNALLIDTICNRFASISNVSEVRLIQEWCHKDWKLKFRHILRDSNKVANCLAMAVTRGLNHLTLFEDPPSYITCLLEDDASASQ